MNTLLLILIDMFMNFAAWDAGQGCCTIPQAVAGHCSEDAIRKYRESMDFNGSFVPCNDGELLFFFQISGEEYDAKQRKFTAATPGWWKTHSETLGDFFYLIGRDGTISGSGLNRMNTPGQVRLVYFPDPPGTLVMTKNDRVLEKKKTPAGIRLNADPEKTPAVSAVRVPARFSLVSESPLRVRFTEGDVSKEFTVRENDRKSWFKEGTVCPDENRYYYSEGTGDFYILEQGGVSESNAEEIDYLLDYRQAGNDPSPAFRKSPPRKQRKLVEEKLAAKYRFRYSVYNAFKHDETYEIDLPAPLSRFCITDRKDVLAYALNGRLYRNGKEICSLLDIPSVPGRFRQTDLVFSPVYFGRNYVLFFLTYNVYNGNGLIVKYDLAGDSASVLYSSADDTELQQWMRRAAEAQNRKNMAFEVKAILRHYYEWGVYLPAIRTYNLFRSLYLLEWNRENGTAN